MSITKKTTKVKIKSKLIGTLEERRVQVNKRIHEYYPNLDILSPYIKANINMKFHCNRCGSTFNRRPYNIKVVCLRCCLV